MDGAGRSEMGPFYCPIHYLSVQSIPSMRALASTNLSATFLRKIQQAMSSFLYREPHKTMIGFLMKSFHFRWTKPFTSWESQHFPWKLSFSIKNFWWISQSQREKVYDWIRQKRGKFHPGKLGTNPSFQLAAIICGKWEFWQIYAQWRLIVGDKCWFFATDHLWPSDAPPAVDHSKVHLCNFSPVCLCSTVCLAVCLCSTVCLVEWDPLVFRDSPSHRGAFDQASIPSFNPYILPSPAFWYTVKWYFQPNCIICSDRLLNTAAPSVKFLLLTNSTKIQESCLLRLWSTYRKNI